MAYDLHHPRTPRISGALLEAVAAFLERPVLGRRLAARLLRATGVDRFRSLHVPEPPRLHPLPATGDAANWSCEDLDRIASRFAPAPGGGFSFSGVRAYAEAYRGGETTPTAVAQRIIATLAKQNRGDPPLYLFIRWNEAEIRVQAEESTRRIQENRARSILEGVPIPIKDEVDVAGFPTTLGTSFLTTKGAQRDAPVVRKLREAGAIILGKTNMDEIGMGVTGLNPNYGTPINPYAPWRYPGGSSSGSAATVALGLAPAAVGADGGGSIRIPAAFCGVYGLKPTFGRIGKRESIPICWSVAHLGPIAGTLEDLAILYAAMAGEIEDSPFTFGQPPLGLEEVASDISGMRVGIYTPWFEDAAEDVLAVARGAVEKLVAAGAELVEIEIPELENLRAAHLVTIASEQKAAMARYYGDHRTDFGIETRANLALAGRLTGGDYIKAQQIRERGLRQWTKIFSTVDAIITPTTGILPPKVPEDRLLSGVSDLATLSEIMRFTPPANLLGFPAMSVPAGFTTAHSRHFFHTEEEKDHDGAVYSSVPVGVQLIAAHWQEAKLFRLARVVGVEAGQRPKPRVYFPSLG